MAREIRGYDDLILDPRNPNQGTARGRYLLERSMGEVGGARSAVADAAGVIRAGNHATEVAHELGLVPVIVPITGAQFVIVQRTDLDPEDPRARMLSYYDNRASEVGYKPDPHVFLEDVEAGIDLAALYREEEIAAVVKQAHEDEREAFAFLERYAENAENAEGGREAGMPQVTAYPLAVVLTPEQYQQWQSWKQHAGLQDDTKAFVKLLEGAMEETDGSGGRILG